MQLWSASWFLPSQAGVLCVCSRVVSRGGSLGAGLVDDMGCQSWCQAVGSLSLETQRVRDTDESPPSRRLDTVKLSRLKAALSWDELGGAKRRLVFGKLTEYEYAISRPQA
jgi:hypothetical protein